MDRGSSNSSASIDVIHFADPWCWWSWGLEPVIQRLKGVYGDQLNVVYKMGGITDNVTDWRKEYQVETDDELVAWISDSSSVTGMPSDPRCYLKAGAKTTWPACIAVKAAELQGEEAGEKFYRILMEAVMLDSKNGSEESTYLEVARKAGLDADKMKGDISSGRARELFINDKKEMDVSFLTLLYVDKKSLTALRALDDSPPRPMV